MEAPEIVKNLNRSIDIAELVLLRVEELELLVTADRPRRLIHLAQAELAAVVADASHFWEHQEDGLIEAASTSPDHEVQEAWRELRSVLALSARRAAEASSAIATRLAVGEDALAALGLHREYARDGSVRTGGPLLDKPPAVMA